MNPVAKGISEDWLSVWIGLLVFVLALGALGGTDILGWVVTTSVWTDLSKALNPVGKAYSGLGGVGALIAIIFTSGVDYPSRFAHSKDVGAHFGLTPRKYQSGETDITGAVSRVGDVMVRTALYEGAHILLTRAPSVTTLPPFPNVVSRLPSGL